MAIAGSFSEFIQRPDSHKIYLADMRLMRRSAVGGTPETFPLYFSTEPYFPPPGSIIDYNEALLGIPSYERSTQEVFSGQSFPSFGPVILANNAGTLDTSFSRNWTKDQPFLMRLGGPPDEVAYGNFGTVLAGIMGMQRNISDQQIEIPIFDDQRRLTAKIPTTTFTSALGPNFPVGNEGMVIPIIYGEVHNFKPILTNQATFGYGVASHAVTQIGSIYDNGANITANATINTSTASFTLSKRPAGVVTCDVKGKTTQAGTYTDRVIGIVEAILIQEAGYGQSGLVKSQFDALKISRNFKVGIAITQQKAILEVIDELISGLLIFYGHNRNGSFDIHQFSAASGTSTLTFQDDVEIQEKFSLDISEPKWRVDITYDPNETVLAENVVAGTVSAERTAWFANANRTVSASDSTVIPFFPYAESVPPITTRLLDKTDATTIANEYLTLVKIPRKIIKAPFGVQPLQVDLGDVITLTRPRYDICGQWRTIGIKEDYVNNTVELELFQ